MKGKSILSFGNVGIHSRPSGKPGPNRGFSRAIQARSGTGWDGVVSRLTPGGRCEDPFRGHSTGLIASAHFLPFNVILDECLHFDPAASSSFVVPASHPV